MPGLSTPCHTGTLQDYLDAKKDSLLNPNGLYLVKLDGGGFTLFLGEQPLKLYEAPQSPSENQ